MPAETVPPECGSNFPAHSVGWVEASAASERNERAHTAVALEGLSEPEWLKNSTIAAGARITLIESDYLLLQ
jgi:hypothetical protein